MMERYAHGYMQNTDVCLRTLNPMISAMLQLQGNQHRHIVYNFDSYGFREGEIIHAKAERVAFGCSHTFGYELENHLTWPFLLNAANFGVSGCSPQTVARLVTAWIPLLPAKTVFIILPESARREIYNPQTETYTHIQNWNLKQLATLMYRDVIAGHLEENHWERIQLLFKEYPELDLFDDEKNQEIEQKCVVQIEEACREKELILLRQSDLPEFNFTSRDGSHNGDVWNRKVSQLFKRRIEA